MIPETMPSKRSRSQERERKQRYREKKKGIEVGTCCKEKKPKFDEKKSK